MILNIVPSILVPDTIIYKFDQPILWYFTMNNSVKKKSKSKMTNEEIERIFLRNISESGVVATYFYMVQDKNEKKAVFEYFYADEFKKWLQEKKAHNGILQRFIQPKGEKNFVVKATWSPKICFLEKVENLQKISNSKLDLYERAVTIDGKDYHSHTVPLRGYILPGKIERICHNICQHLKNCSMDKVIISRMVMNFKVDSEDRIWFIFASSLRLDLGDATSSQKKYFSLPKEIDSTIKHTSPDNINVDRVSTSSKYTSFRKNDICLSCNKKLDKYQIIQIKYENIIKGYEYDHLLSNKADFEHTRNDLITGPSTQTVDDIIKNDIKLDRLRPMTLPLEFYEIPPLIRKIHPSLKPREYKQLKLEPGFWKKEIIVCETCYLNICKSITVSGDVNKGTDPKTSKRLFGTGSLRPNNINDNRQRTMEKIQRQRIAEDIKLDDEEKKIRETMTQTFRCGRTKFSAQGDSRFLKSGSATNRYNGEVHLSPGLLEYERTPQKPIKMKNRANESDDGLLTAGEGRGIDFETILKKSEELEDSINNSESDSESEQSSQITSLNEYYGSDNSINNPYSNRTNKFKDVKFSKLEGIRAAGTPLMLAKASSLSQSRNANSSSENKRERKDMILEPLNYTSKSRIQRQTTRDTDRYQNRSLSRNSQKDRTFDLNSARETKSSFELTPKKHYLNLLSQKKHPSPRDTSADQSWAIDNSPISCYKRKGAKRKILKPKNENDTLGMSEYYKL